MSDNYKIKPIYAFMPYLIISILAIKSSYNVQIVIGTIIFSIVIYLALFKAKFILTPKYIFLLITTLLYLFFSIIYECDIVGILKGYTSIIIMIFPIIVFDINFNIYLDEKIIQDNAKKITNVLVVLFIYTIIITIYCLNTNIYFARMMASYNAEILGLEGIYKATGGGYALVYGTVLIIPLILFLIKESINKKQKLMFVGILSCLMYFIIMANFATAFIIMLFGIAIYVINIRKRFDIKVLVLLISIIIILLQYSTIIKFVITLLPQDSIIAIRLTEMIEKGNNETSYNARKQLMSRTLETLKQTYFLGIGYKYDFNYDEMAKELGLHTEWLDLIGKYGIFVGSTIIIFIFKSLLEIRNRFKDAEEQYLLDIAIILFVIMGLFNPITLTSIGIVIFILYPSVLFIKRGMKNEENFNNNFR